MEAKLDSTQQRSERESNDRVRLNQSIEDSSLARRRSMQAHLMKPILEEKAEITRSLAINQNRNKNSLEAAPRAGGGGKKLTTSNQDQTASNPNVISSWQASRRPVFSNHQNRDLVSLSEQEDASNENENRPPMHNLRRAMNAGRPASGRPGNNNNNRKRNAIKTLLKDKQMATELIRLYANNNALVQSQQRLLLATSKPPKPPQRQKKSVKSRHHDAKVAESRKGSLPKDSSISAMQQVMGCPGTMYAQRKSMPASQLSSSRANIFSAEQRKVEKLFEVQRASMSPNRQFSNISNLYKSRNSSAEQTQSGTITMLNLHSKLMKPALSHSKGSLATNTQRTPLDPTLAKDDQGADAVTSATKQRTYMHSPDRNQTASSKRIRLMSAKHRPTNVFQDQVLNLASNSGRAGKRLRPQSSKPSQIRSRQRRGIQAQQFSQRQSSTIFGEPKRTIASTESGGEDGEERSMTKFSHNEFVGSEHKPNKVGISIDLTRERQFLKNTRLINNQRGSMHNVTESGKNLANGFSAEDLLKVNSSGGLAAQPAVQESRRKRPTTAPRKRTDMLSTNLGGAASSSKIRVTLENSSEQRGNRSQQKHKIKSYLKKEINLNRFVSVNDYKNMTKQVKDLRNLESTYLSESLTANQFNRTASQINNNSFVSSASHTQLGKRIQSFQKKPRGQVYLGNQQFQRRTIERRQSPTKEDHHTDQVNTEIGVGQGDQIIDIVSTHTYQSELGDTVQHPKILAVGQKPQRHQNMPNSTVKGSKVFRRVNQLNQIGDAEINQMRLAVQQKEMELAEQRSSQQLNKTRDELAEIEERSQATFVKSFTRRSRPQTAKPINQKRGHGHMMTSNLSSSKDIQKNATELDLNEMCLEIGGQTGFNNDESGVTTPPM